MTRSAIDVTVAAYAPAGRAIYLGYIDGNYRSYQDLKNRFADALVVPIAVLPSTDAGLVFDGPPDNATWPQVVNWVVMRRRSGADPTVYTDRDQWAAGVNAFNTRGVPPPHWWIADWNLVADIPAGAVGHQYRSVQGRYDESVFLDHWPGVDPPLPSGPPPPSPAPGAAPPPQEEPEMLLMSVAAPPTGPAPGIWLLSGDLYAHVTDVPTATALQGAGVKQASISYAQHQAILDASAALKGKLAGTLNISGQLAAS